MKDSIINAVAISLVASIATCCAISISQQKDRIEVGEGKTTIVRIVDGEIVDSCVIWKNKL